MQGEQVVGVIPMARTKTGFFTTKPYTLVFTSLRLIVAEARKDLVQAEVERSKAEARAGGSGRLGQWGAQVKASNRFGYHYLGSDPEAILAETPGNVAFRADEIRELKIDRRTRNAGSDDEVEMVFLHVTLDTSSGRRTYDTDIELPSLDEARALAARLLGPR